MQESSPTGKNNNTFPDILILLNKTPEFVAFFKLSYCINPISDFVTGNWIITNKNFFFLFSGMPECPQAGMQECSQTGMS
jgi:hypothetical protein